MKKNKEDARKIILAKIAGLKSAKGSANFQNRVRSMQIALANRDKLVASELKWSETFVTRAKTLKTKLTVLGKQDPANFNRVIDLWNKVKSQDLTKAKELAIARMERDIEKCLTEEQKTIVSQYYEQKTLREIQLKSLLKDILVSEGYASVKPSQVNTEVAQAEPVNVPEPSNNPAE